MTAIVEFLFPAPAPRSAAGIFRWWEGRRLKYNLLVGGTGLMSWGFVSLLSFLPPGAHAETLPWQAVIVFGVGANIFYGLGPIVELSLERLWGRKVLPTGPALFRMGLTFSLGLTLLPSLLMVLDYGIRILKAVL